MRILTTDQFVAALSHKVTIHFRIKDLDQVEYKWTEYRADPFRLEFDPATYDYYCDCPIAMWHQNVSPAMYQQFMRTKDLAPLILQSQPYDPWGDYWEYVGFIRRIDSDRHYHVKMGYDSKWIGIWEIEKEAENAID